jgi:transglutaminase-like putative cysteine protease
VQEFLVPTAFVDSAASNIVAFARQAVGIESDPVARAVRLYYAVRDGIVYTPYCDFRSLDTFRASAVLARGHGFCVGKATVLAAVARASGIPARVGFADVRNHLCTPRLRELVGGDVFYYHGYTEMAVAGQWVKATPAFDRVLCDKFGVRPLEFDGRADSLFHAYDRTGRRHMEYLRDHGAHADVPVDEIVATFAREYPRLMENGSTAGDRQFRKEAEENA